jgi:hypothetical protein
MGSNEREATSGTVVPTIQLLRDAGERFYLHADAITNQARLDIAHDLRLAGRISTAYANLRRGIADEAGRTMDSASANRLRGLLCEEM